MSDARAYHLQGYWEHRARCQLTSRSSAAAQSDAAIDDADDVTNEWYYDFDTLRPLLSITPRMRQCAVLDLGCGFSTFLDELASAGFTGALVGVDSSPSIVAERRRRRAAPPSPSSALSSPVSSTVFECRDLFAFNSDFRSARAEEESRYGLIVDKATSDGMMCHDCNVDGIQRMYAMVGWALQPGGTFLLVSVQESDSAWCTELLLPSLMEGDGHRHAWHVAVHSIHNTTYYDGEHEGPNVFVAIKGVRERKDRAAKQPSDEVVLIHSLH